MHQETPTVYICQTGSPETSCVSVSSDRETGAPVWPIIETRVSRSAAPGEITSPTQPIPSKPPPFVRQGSVVRQGSAREDLVDPSSAVDCDVGPLFTPPNTKGLIVTPGEGGGVNWGGASYEPNTQTLYVNGFGPLSTWCACKKEVKRTSTMCSRNCSPALQRYLHILDWVLPLQHTT